MRPLLILTALGLYLTATPAQAQLRIVTYNTNTFQPGTPDGVARFVQPEVDTVIQAIGEESVNGIARAPDILLFQEHQRPTTTTANLLTRLNNLFGAGFYARGFETSFVTGSNGFGPLTGREIRQTVIYRTDSVQLLEEDSFGFVSGPVQPRETLQYKFRPLGYGAEADLYVFNSHFEAGDGSGDLTSRFTEAVNIRERADSFGAGANVIVAGDLNVDSSFESSLVRLFEEPGTFIEDDVFTGAVGGGAPFSTTVDRTLGDAQLFDPLDRPGNYNNNPAFADIHTQSPFNPNDSSAGFTAFGIDDRFDFILTSAELLDQEGVGIIDGSYRAFGNNGSTFNDPINVGNTISINGLTSFTTAEVLDALAVASDHLPVVADFQLPAILSASVVSIDDEIFQGETGFLTLDIENTAPVDVPIGADELDYTVTFTGDTTFNVSGSDLADGVADQIVIPLDTSVVGERSFQGVVATTSEGVPVDSLPFNLTYTVLAAGLAGDFNDDGVVDAADYTVWRDGLGGEFSPEDYLDWRNNFGATSQGQILASTSNAPANVPEPASLVMLLLLAACRQVAPIRCRA